MTGRFLTWLVLASLLLSGACAQGSVAEVAVVNAGFEDGEDPEMSAWLRIDGAFPNRYPSNYGERIPGLPSRTVQLKSDGGNFIQQSLVETGEGAPIDAAAFPFWSIAPGGTGEIVVGFKPGSATGDSAAILRVDSAGWSPTTSCPEPVGSKPPPCSGWTGGRSCGSATASSPLDNCPGS